MNTKENNYELIKFEDGDFSLDVKVSFENNTVWLTQKDLASLFERNRTVINKHIKSIFNDLELKRGSVCAKFAHTASDGKTYQVDYYNASQKF